MFRSIKQYLEYLHRIAPHIEERYDLGTQIPSEVLPLIATFCGDNLTVVIHNGSGTIKGEYYQNNAFPTPSHPSFIY